MGGGQICLCVAFLLGKKETHQQNSRKFQENAGTILGQFCLCVSCLLAFVRERSEHCFESAVLEERTH